MFVRPRNEELSAAKSFQRQAIGARNERRQPISCHQSDGRAFLLITKEFSLINEHFDAMEPVQPVSLSH
jgi:hypothetical protein